MKNDNNEKIPHYTKPLLCNGFRLKNIVSRGYMNPAPTGLKKEFEPCEIQSLGIERIIVNSKINSNELIKMSYDNIKPVVLTKFWLNKLGFFIIETNGIFEATLPNFRYSIQNAENYEGFFFCDGETVLTNFNYIHELQNLVFVLGQRELTVA